MAKRLYVGNLAYGVSSQDLQEMFEQYGQVRSAQVLSDRETGRSRGFGFVEMDNDEDADASDPAPVIAWRNPLTTARGEEDDARRLLEGQALAQALLKASREVPVVEGKSTRPMRWSDIMLLVRKRSHLAAYESALRAAGIPFISDKRGGLLESLEIADLIALLTFLITPNDTRALAHVLKSPIIGAADDDLVQIARRAAQADGGHWWQHMLAMQQEGVASAALVRAVGMLQRWLQAAPHLPVHDLLDMILHQGDLVARYAQYASPLTRSQTLGNIAAFVELSLNMDAGRYPSLPKFIDALRVLQRSAGGDAPDEASVDASADAVRILTVHSAKGLEAPVVAILDANHSESVEDNLGIICEWPQDRDAPTHFSAFGRRSERGVARQRLFDEEDALRQQEDWNLLYVAVTRAKQLLLVSGVAGNRGAGEGGVVAGSWYERLFASDAPVREISEEAVQGAQAAALEERFELSLFEPRPVPLSLFGAGTGSGSGAGEAETPTGVAEDGTLVASEAIDEGVALHALLERLTHAQAWPLALPAPPVLVRWLGVSAEMAQVVHAQARQIVQDRKVPRSGEVEYRFTADGAIRTLLVNDDLKKKLSTGALVIARLDDRYELLPRVAADKVRERDAAMIVLDHGQANEPAAATSEDDAYYAQFKVPDDLVW